MKSSQTFSLKNCVILLPPLDEVQTARRRTERNEIDGEAPDGREGRGGDDRFALNFGGKGATIAIGEQLEPLISPLEASDRRSPFVSRLNDDAKEELTEAEPRNRKIAS